MHTAEVSIKLTDRVLGPVITDRVLGPVITEKGREACTQRVRMPPVMGTASVPDSLTPRLPV